MSETRQVGKCHSRLFIARSVCTSVHECRTKSGLEDLRNLLLFQAHTIEYQHLHNRQQKSGDLQHAPFLTCRSHPQQTGLLKLPQPEDFRSAPDWLKVAFAFLTRAMRWSKAGEAPCGVHLRMGSVERKDHRTLCFA